MKSVYVICIVLAVLFGVYLFVNGNTMAADSILMWIAFIPFFMFAYGLIGIIISTQLRKQHSFFWWVIFPGLMAGVFYILHFIHVLILEPLLCPCN